MDPAIMQTEFGWEQILAQGMSQPKQLLDALGIEPASLRWPIDPQSPFRTKVPQPFVARMQPGNPHDPLGENSRLAAPGLISKYAHRVLLTLTGACAIHCRYCFRRAFPYTDVVPKQHDWQPTYDYIKADKSIEEVIFSGGDPLMLKDNKLAAHIGALANIDHIDTLRIHTRTPIVLPQRITEGLKAALALWPKQLVIVVHSNHPAEIDDAVESALKLLATMSDALLNQSVLLAGVNADAMVLATLSKRLFVCGVLPYYLHALDKVSGAAHFAVSDVCAEQIMTVLRATLPGYLVPRFVREIPGEPNKTPV